MPLGTLNSTKTGITGTPARTQTWDPDGAGNFDGVNTNGTNQSRSHNRQNQITALGSATPTYDNDGNLTGDGTWTITYDAWNRVITMTAGANNATYKYDALSRRISEEGTPVTVLGPLHLYYNAAWQVIEERWTYFNEDTLIGGGGGEGGGGMAPESFTGPNVSARYVWSPAGIDTMVLRDRDTTSDGVPDERLYVQQDAQSNVTALVNTSGAVVERSIQDPYGVRTVLDASHSPLTTSNYSWKYYHQGLRLDWTQTLYDNRMRMYSPTLMRFLQNDPIGFAAGDQNTYRYVGNGPGNYIDPAGLAIGVAPVESAGNVPWRKPGSQNWWDNPLVDQSAPTWADNLVNSLPQSVVDYIAGPNSWGSIFGAIGGGYGAAIVVGGILCWTPIGWGLLVVGGIGVAGGVAIGAVVGHRHGGNDPVRGGIAGIAAGGLWGLAVAGTYIGIRGSELRFGPNVRVAPLGNRGLGRWQRPHYHRRIIDPVTGQPRPGGGIHWHRPWEAGQGCRW